MQGLQLIESGHGLCAMRLVCVQTGADQCIDHASVQMGKRSVHEVRVVHVGIHGHLCRSASAASEGG